MRCLVKAKWVVIALVAPEFVVFNAWSQRRHALRVAKVLRRRSGQEDPESFMTALRRMFGMEPQKPDQEQGMRGSNVSVNGVEVGNSIHSQSCEESGLFGKV